jgi:UDP-glucose 4-epimerase
MSRAFVTGGAGFIGSHLVDRLKAEGDIVTVYDNLSSGKEAFISQHLGKHDFGFIRADLLELKRLTESMKGHDIVFHLAANPEAREGISRTKLDLEQNTVATYNVLESMRINHVKRMVFTSSGTVYGETPNIPVKEDYGPLLPISLYGASKLACEGLISAFCHLFNMQACIFRPGNIVGPRSTHGVIYDLLNKLEEDPRALEVLGDGDQTKPFVYVDDCIEGLLIGAKNARDKVNVFNLAPSTVTSVKDIVKMILEKTGHENVAVKYTGEPRGWPGDVPKVHLSGRKLEKLGWHAKRSSNDAVATAIEKMVECSGKRKVRAASEIQPLED